MDPKDRATPDSASVPSGGIGIAEPIFQAPVPTDRLEQIMSGPPTPEAPTPPPEPLVPPAPAADISVAPDTIVIPPTTPDASPSAASPAVAANPFIPNVPVAGAPAAPSAGRSPVIKIFLLFIMLAVLGIGGFMVWSRMSAGAGGVGLGGEKQVTINYWGLWENDAVTRQFIADFETTHPKIKVQYTQQSPKQYRERLQSAINRGEGPDVFRFHNTWIPMLRNQLALVPSTVMPVAEFNSAFFPVASNDLVAGTSIFGIPLMIDGLGLYINDELFATAGVTEPSTWTDVINLIPKLTVKNGSAIVTSAIALGTTNNIEHFSDILGLMFLQNGAPIANPTGPEAEGTLVFYKKFSDTSDPLYTWSDGMDNSVSAFANGRVAMIIAPSWRAHEISQLNPKLRFHIAPVPQLQGNAVAWASYWVEGVSSRSKYQEAAWEFVKYMTSKEGASKLYTEAAKTRLFGEPYARVELANTISEDPYLGAYVKQAVFARSFPLASRTYDNGLNDKLIQYATDAVNGMGSGGSPTQVLVTMSQGFRQVLASYGLSAVPETTPTP